MGASIPKQYLELCGRPIVAWSLRLFASMPEVKDVVVVCEPEYKDLISKHWLEARERAASAKGDGEAGHPPSAAATPELKWAAPGAERQDSVQSGLSRIDPSTRLVAVHDSARPLTTAADVRLCLADASACGAAVLGVPVKPTIKEVNDDGTVARTLVRARLWEVQTPQVVEPGLLRRGFAFAIERGLEVTDDVSVVELLGETVRITQGSYTNIKASFRVFREGGGNGARLRAREQQGKTKHTHKKMAMKNQSKIILVDRDIRLFFLLRGERTSMMDLAFSMGISLSQIYNVVFLCARGGGEKKEKRREDREIVFPIN